jgi:hypothetical protein
MKRPKKRLDLNANTIRVLNSGVDVRGGFYTSDSKGNCGTQLSCPEFCTTHDTCLVAPR